jgi:D-serine dehydratase
VTRQFVDRLDELADHLLPAGTKGLPLAVAGMTLGQLAASGLSVLSGSVPMPIAVLKERQLSANIVAMQHYCDGHGVSLCPHGKTTLAPQIFARQLDAGAWGITAATPSHLRLYRHYGIDRIFYANELVEAEPIAWLAGELNDNPDFDFYCIVDSISAVEVLDRNLREAGLQRTVNVLVEVGHAGGRCGVRDRGAAAEVAAAVDAATTLQLTGVECFEGLPPISEALPMVDEFLDTVAAVAADMAVHTSLARADCVMLSAGGSAFFDRVVEKFRYGTRLDAPVHVVLRSGCYVTQDGGFYAQMSPLHGRAADKATLENALEVWGAVLSRPEPDFVVTSVGRRDCSYDQGLPTPSLTAVPGASPTVWQGAATVGMSDQHTHIGIESTWEVKVGDLVGFVVSHPCSTFEKWKVLPVVDDDYRVVDAVLTAF